MRGFTLVELLIVMVLIGVMGGMAVLTMGQSGHGRRAALEAGRLAELLELAEQEAWVAGEIVGLELSSVGYRFLQWRDDGWQVHGDALFQPRELSPLSLGLMFDGEIAVLPPRLAFSPQPQIVLTPEGDSGEFQIAVGDNAERFSLNNSAGDGLQIVQEQLAR